MAVASTRDVRTGAGREPRARDFVRLKLRLLRNGFRGQAWRVVAFVVGLGFGLFLGGVAFLGLVVTGAASRDVGYVAAAFAGTAVVAGWILVPLLFFGVDETLDPARFALLPIGRMTLARGMLAAAFVGVPAVATLFATAGLVVAAAIRFGWSAAGVSLLGIVAGLVLGVVASRAVTSAFAALLRSRRVRDLAAVVIALLASSIGPLQWLITAAIQRGNVAQALRGRGHPRLDSVGRAVRIAVRRRGGAAGRGRCPARAHRGSDRAAVVVVVPDDRVGDAGCHVRRCHFPSRGVSPRGVPSRGADGVAGGAVASLIPRPMRRIAGTGVFGAILARESRFWWRDPRRRASLLSILMASAVLPIAVNFAASGSPTEIKAAPALGFSFAVTMSGTMAGMLLANQFSFDGSAFAAHLLTQVPGKVELRARAAAIGMVAVPVQLLVVVVVAILGGSYARLPAGLGLLAASFGVSVAVAAILSVLAPYALPENTNPFAINSGGGSAKGLLAILALLGTLALSTPVVVASALLSDVPLGPWLVGPWVVLAIGLGYGMVAVWLGTYIAGDLLERRGPEVLVAVTPRR